MSTARRFLTYIVEETIAGRSEGIKELVLGTAVFDRPADFDPRMDTIVRVEAGKLRKRLEEYYARGGASTQVRIDIPKGSYVPRMSLAVQPDPRTGEPSAEGDPQVAPVGDTPTQLAGTPIASPAVRSSRAVGVAAVTLVVLLGLAGVTWWWSRGTASAGETPPEASIAVLPFTNFSPDPENEYLADGLAEDLTDALSRLGTIRVLARTSAFSFKDRQDDVRDIGARLNVRFLIEGSVRREGDRLKVTAQLVRTDDGYHVWSQSFERNIRDVLTVQDEIARAVVDGVKFRIGGGAIPRRQPHTPNFQAFDYYLQGAHALDVDIERAERLLLQSAAADPAYARPHVALARLYIVSDIYGLGPTPELIVKARAALEKALTLDDQSAEAHSVLGSLLARHEYKWEEAEAEIRRGLTLDPNSSLAHNDFAQNVLAPQERWDEAVAETRLALELDPLSNQVAAGEAFLRSLRRDNRGAIDAFSLAVARNGGFLVESGLAGVLLETGDLEKGLELLKRAGPVANTSTMMAFKGYGYGRAGRRADAEAILKDLLEAEVQKRFVNAGAVALVYTGLGDVPNALRYLERARVQQESGLIFLRVGAPFDSLRREPRFAALLSEVGLSDEQVDSRRVNR